MIDLYLFVLYMLLGAFILGVSSLLRSELTGMSRTSSILCGILTADGVMLFIFGIIKLIAARGGLFE